MPLDSGSPRACTGPVRTATSATFCVSLTALQGSDLRAAELTSSCRGPSEGLCRQWLPELEGWAEGFLCVTWKGELGQERMMP